MEQIQNFRSAFNGFNRSDVVQYLEYINNKHTAQVNQLMSETEFLRQKLISAPAEDQSELVADLQEQLAAALADKAALEQRCQELEQALSNQPAAVTCGPDQELEAYRRAERAEREAKERADVIYRQTNLVVAEATAKVDDAASRLDSASRQVLGQIAQLQSALECSRQAMQDVSATMSRLRSGSEN